MGYEHGVRVQENPTTVPAPVSSNAGVPVVFGTSPVNLAADVAAAVNKPVLCNTFAEAKAKLGYSDDYDNFTLCQAMDAFFKAFAVGPVVFVNVLDPATHKTAITAISDASLTDGVYKIDQTGMILSSIVVKDHSDSSTLVLDTDYTLAFDSEEKVIVTVTKVGVTSIDITGNKINASAVVAADVVGSIDANDKASGIEVIRDVYPVTGRFPSLILAPGWSQNATVGQALALKCEDINGSWKCECVVDLSSASGGALKVADVATKKAAAGYTNPHTIIVWPMVMYAGKKVYMSAMYAAMATYTDINNDNVPSLSPSNRPLRVAGACLADGTEINLDKVAANTVNAAGVVTVINLNGFKAWGNNTAAYPDVTDPKDRWIACRRFFSWWGNTFIETYLEKVDNPANYRLIESIVDSENVRGNALVSMQKCAGIRMEYRQEDNPVANVIDGKIRFRQYLAPYTPAEDILNILEFDPSMIEAALGGE